MTTLTIPAKPIPSLLLGAAGGALVGARTRRPAIGAVTTLVGLALVGLAASGPVGTALRRAGTRRHATHLRKSIVVPHPVGDVYRFCSDFENFPKFVRALRAVTDYGDGRSHWVGWTPSGRLVEWDAVTTKFVPNRVIAWQSVPASPVRTSCTLRFVPERSGGTCVKVAVEYALPTERLRDAVSALARRTRTRELEADIGRLGEQLDRVENAASPTG